ncbi:MAG TPA: LytR C-terminal domain-containing protein [Egibacteraceae bacterium]|nr:LytR C-terminal domain-containing protein [Egibacteraceae bacterium]
MGRHADPDPRWFWLSLAAAAGKALLAVALVGLAAAGLVRWLGGGDEGEKPVVTLDDTGEPAPADTVTSSPTPTPTGFQDEPAVEGPEATADGGDDGPVRATVQVLNASGDPDKLGDVVEVLEELGYQVVAQSRAARGYDETTVFWSAGFEDEAERLQDTDDRFGVLERNDRLDASIDLHVVIGRDWVADS